MTLLDIPGSPEKRNNTFNNNLNEYELDFLDSAPMVKRRVKVAFRKWRQNTFTEKELRTQDVRKRIIEESPQKRKRTFRENTLSYLTGCMPAWSNEVQKYPIIDFIDYTLRGSGQVIFCNNSISGLIILMAIYVGDPWIGVCATAGLLSATLMALFLNFNKGAIRAGLFGFNGVLVGAALGTFLGNGTYNGSTIAAIVLMSTFSTILTAAIANFNGAFKLPTFTLPFNLCAIVFMLGVYQFYHFEMIEGINGSFSRPHDVTPINHFLSSDLVRAVLITHPVLRGVSQVWLINNEYSGVMILAGMAVCSPVSSFFAFLGSAVGLFVGLCLGVNVEEALNGLWGYNAVLGCVALGGVFYILCVKQVVLCILGSTLCTVLLGTFKGLFATLGMPAFTFPFCLGTIVFILLQNSLPDVISMPLASITTPERHIKLRRIALEAIERLKHNMKVKRERRKQGLELSIIVVTEKGESTRKNDPPIVIMAAEQ